MVVYVCDGGGVRRERAVVGLRRGLERVRVR